MRYVIRATQFPARVDWTKPENLVRLGILVLVIAAIVAAFMLRDNFGASEVGYGVVALSALVASAGLVIPVPALATACATAIALSPRPLRSAARSRQAASSGASAKSDGPAPDRCARPHP